MGKRRDDLERSIQSIVASAGGDAKRVKVPETKHGLNVRSHRVGDTHILIAAPDSGASSTAPVITTADAAGAEVGVNETLVRGRVLSVRDQLLLMMSGGFELPLIVPIDHMEFSHVLYGISQEYRDSETTLRGVLTERGFIVTELVGGKALQKRRIRDLVYGLPEKDFRILIQVAQQRFAEEYGD